MVGIEELGRLNYPQIAAVGMAAAEGREPRIVELRWDPPTGSNPPSSSSAATASSVSPSMATATDGSPIVDSEYPEVVIIGKGTNRTPSHQPTLFNPY